MNDLIILVSWQNGASSYIRFHGKRTGSKPIGGTFLPSHSIPRLERLYRKEKDPRAKLRLLAAMLRKNGRTMGQIADELHTPLGTGHAWLRRLTDGPEEPT